MATAGTITVPISSAAESLDATVCVRVRVGGLRRFRFRVWLAGRLVRAAAVVLPLPTKVIIEDLHVEAPEREPDDTTAPAGTGRAAADR